MKCALSLQNSFYMSSNLEDEGSTKSHPWGLAVRGVILDQAGRLLLIRRSRQCGRFVGTWEFPGGKVDSGETIDVAVRREVQEETSLIVHLKAVAGLTECDMPNMHLVTIYFYTTLAAGPVILSEEHDDFIWVLPSETQRLNLNSQAEDFTKQHSVPNSTPGGCYAQQGAKTA